MPLRFPPSLLLVPLFVCSCVPPRTSPPTHPTPSLPQAGQVQQEVSALQSADRLLAEGRDHLLSGRDLEARRLFDRAINLLLDAAPDHPDLAEAIDDRIDEISALELAFYEDLASDKTPSDNEALEDTIRNPLFALSQKDILAFRETLTHLPPSTIPIVDHPLTWSFLKAFQTSRRANIQRAFDRSAPYIGRYREIFAAQGLPLELVYLPVIESGFRFDATSRARARGIWQFMASTARLFGLKVDWVVDERQDPIKSAQAAASYLKWLYKEFGDWHLVLVSYNAGPGRVSRAIRKMKSREFASLVKSKFLKRETRNYLPAFMAVLTIVRQPEAFGFSVPQSAPLFPGTHVVDVPSPVSLKSVGGLCGLSVAAIRELNPELLQDMTPFDRPLYPLRLPVSAPTTGVERLPKLPPSHLRFSGWYQVRKGDTLYAIARKFKTSVDRIRKANRLRGNLLRPGHRLLIPRH